MGGIGVGYFDYAPDGQIKRVAINNWSPGDPGVLTDTSDGTFFALWEEDVNVSNTGHAYALQRPPVGGAVGAAGLGDLSSRATNFTGLFPTASLQIDDGQVEVKVWSPLVPHQIENSSLPLAYVDVTVHNSGTAERAFSAVVSWQDVISRGIFSPSAEQIVQHYPVNAVPDRCARDVADFRGAANKCNASELRGRTTCTDMERAATHVESLQVGSLSGLEQRATTRPFKPHKLTMQMYNDRVALMATKDAPGDQVSLLKAYNPGTTSGASVEAWKLWMSTGAFPGGGSAFLHQNASSPEMASAVAIRAKLKPGASRTLRFVVAWHAPEVYPNASGDFRTVCGSTDHNHMFHNRFSGTQGLENLITYASKPAVRQALEIGTREWHQPILSSTMPQWLQFKIINSAYTLMTNTLLNKAGFFSVMEGGMSGQAGTMDQRVVAHPFYFKFFTTQDSLELAQFGTAQNPGGAIDHFDASIYASITGVTNDSIVCAMDEYEDNTEGWLYQLAKTFMRTGNLTRVLEQKDRITAAIQYANSQLVSAKGPGSFHLPGAGSNTYDDFWMLPIEPYMASMYNLGMKASAILARAVGNEPLASDCEQRAAASGADFVHALFNGKFFAYGCQTNGSGRTDDLMFNGQLAGQMLSRHAGWGDLSGIPFDNIVSSVEAQLTTFVKQSHNFFPAKVYNLSSQSAARDPEPGQNRVASTWSFYLESYTALLAIQTGWRADGLEIIKHIGLVNLRLGLQWSQNLWQPGFDSYVAAPVSWFIPDVLASAGLDVANHTLMLAPAMEATDYRVELPLFFPQLWATVIAQRTSSSSGSIKVAVTKVFGEPLEVRQVVALPIGVPSTAAVTIALKVPFVCVEGAELNLSAHWAVLTAASVRPRVLPREPPGEGCPYARSEGPCDILDAAGNT
jgi:uncharacterized protein (DUF608 family)